MFLTLYTRLAIRSWPTTAYPFGRGKQITWFAAIPLAFLVIGALPSSGIAQGPGEKYPCRACSPQLCIADDNVYSTCTWSLNGTTLCDVQEQDNGCPITDTCRDHGDFCEGGDQTMALGPARDAAIRAFESGGMLPGDGNFYVATRGDRLLLRSKCGANTVIARIDVSDVGMTRVSVTTNAGG